MEELIQGADPGLEGHHHPHHGHDVTVTVDGVKHEVRKGDYIVSQFKALVGVDAARELDEVVHGEFKPLDDNARIDIKGGEIFVSHVRTGGSSQMLSEESFAELTKICEGAKEMVESGYTFVYLPGLKIRTSFSSNAGQEGATSRKF